MIIDPKTQQILNETTAEAVLKKGDLTEVVDYAVARSRLLKLDVAEVDKTKPFLREHGSIRCEAGKQSVVLEGTIGNIQITFPDARVLPRKVDKKERELAELEKKLPPEVFAALFKKRVVVEPALGPVMHLETLAQLSQVHRAVVESYVEIVESTPQVRFPT